MATDSGAVTAHRQAAEPAPLPAQKRREGGAARATLATPRRSNRLQRRENAAGYLFLSPWLIGFFLLTAGPMLFSLYLAFTRGDCHKRPGEVLHVVERVGVPLLYVLRVGP